MDFTEQEEEVSQLPSKLICDLGEYSLLSRTQTSDMGCSHLSSFQTSGLEAYYQKLSIQISSLEHHSQLPHSDL